MSPIATFSRLRRQRLFGNSPGSEKISLRRRLTWIVKDKTAFKNLLARLRSLFDTLYEMLDTVQQDSIQDDLRFLHLQMVNLVDKIEDIHALKSAMEALIGPQSDACSCAAVKTLRLELERNGSN